MKNGKKSNQLSLMEEKIYSGRIVTHYGNQLEVEILNGPLEGTTQRCHQRSSMTNLVTGDLSMIILQSFNIIGDHYTNPRVILNFFS